jgi:DNA repair exonuclease SbcCD ATPase subunit
MTQLEELLNEIEKDKDELFQRIGNLEEENERLLNEKHELKQELNQTLALKKDQEQQMKSYKGQIKILESLNNYKDDELKDTAGEKRLKTGLEEEVSELRGLLTKMREEEEINNEEKMKLTLANVELKTDLEREKEYIANLKREINEFRLKHAENFDLQKTNLNMSNLIASKMFNHYRMRETMRQSTGGGMPTSFVGEAPVKQYQAGLQESNLVNSTRPSLRESCMISTFWLRSP